MRKNNAPEIVYDTISTDSGDFKTTLTEKYKNRTPWRAPDPRQIFSFIPGTITTINVEPGQQVKEGDILFTFKAMKMINVYNSPVDGVVARILVKPEQIVPKGELLLEFE